ncbi:MAG: hypothetical protein RLZZ350_1058, partial [Verrucomicrobiota bacterium]
WFLTEKLTDSALDYTQSGLDWV